MNDVVVGWTCRFGAVVLAVSTCVYRYICRSLAEHENEIEKSLIADVTRSSIGCVYESFANADVEMRSRIRFHLWFWKVPDNAGL